MVWKIKTKTMIINYLNHWGGNFRSYLLLGSALLKKPSLEGIIKAIKKAEKYL